jgi:asparagine synthase (glutamine-hydrolysing)
MLRRDNLEIFPYWVPDYRKKLAVSEEEARELLESELRRSVNSMLVSDVPLGAFISGGVDSGLIAALMTECSGRPVETFNLGFKNTSARSEHLEAESVATHIGSRHHSLMIDYNDALDSFEEWIDIFDEPFADSAALPTLLLSKLTRNYVKVVLTGEGADEVFSGYSTYRKRDREEVVIGLLGGRWSPLPFLVSRLPRPILKDRILHALTKPLSQRYVTIPTVFHEAQRKSIYSKPFFMHLKLQLAEFAGNYFEECNSAYYLDRIMYVDTRLWLPEDLLTKVDRATMAHSLEARVPYLDHQLVEFAAQLLPEMKQRGDTTKFILKRVAEKYLPQEIVHRDKQGFIMPLKEWLENELVSYLLDNVSEEGLLSRNLLNPVRINRLVRDHINQKKNHSFKLWALLVLELWFQRYEPDFSL